MSRTNPTKKRERIIIITTLIFLILITLFLLNFNSNPFPTYERGPDGKALPKP